MKASLRKRKQRRRKMIFRSRRVGQKAISLAKIKEKTEKLLFKLTPREISTYTSIKTRYEKEVGKNSNRIMGDLTQEEKYMALISSLSYKTGQERTDVLKALPGFSIVDDLSDENSVVVETSDKKTSVIGFRGTKPTNVGDLVADYHIAFGKTKESSRFKEAETKYNKVKERYTEVKVTGHSLGGAQAIHVAKLFGVQCWAWNPGQGVSDEYLSNAGVYPNIRTYHIIGDPISDTAGLENPKMVYRFPKVSSSNPLANHALTNFTN